VKAVVRHAYGPPESLELVDIDKPVPAEGEVLIRVRATALNASDVEVLTGEPLYGRLWGLFTPAFEVLGSDVAGTVEAVGAGVTRFAPGDAVYGDLFEIWGGFAEYACAPESMLRHKPESLSFEQAAALPQSGTIALQGLRDTAHVRPGQRVLINGAGGGAGSFAIQIAKAMGAEVTAVDSGEKLELVRSLGADHTIDYAKEDFTHNRRRYDIILDMVGHHSIFDFKRSLAPGGRYLMVGGSIKLFFGVFFFGSIVSLLTRKSMKLLTIKTNRDLGALESLVQSGAVVPAIDKTFPLHQAPEALRWQQDGHAKGKLVIAL